VDVGLAQELRFLLGVDLFIEAAVRQIISAPARKPV
jgi:hypothetical protein